MKKFILLISIIFMSLNSSISYGNFKYSNDRFSSIILESKKDIEKGDIEGAKVKIYNYLDKTNFLFCDGYNYLKELGFSGDNNILIDNLTQICTEFTSGNFQKSFELLSSLSVDKSKVDGDIYLVYKLLEYSVYKVTVTSEGYEKLYNLDEVNNFLTENKDLLELNFPISYNFRLGMGYFDQKDKDKFNLHYDILKDKDFYLKPFFEINDILINGKGVDEFNKILDYERVLLKDNNGSYNANNYFFVYKYLYDYYLKTGDENNEIDYFLKLQKELGLLGDYQTFKYLLAKKNISNYEEKVKTHIDSQYYNFLVNFSLLKSFIDGGVKLPKEDYDKLMIAYKFLLEYYKINKLSIENGRVETSFKETYIDFGLIQLINLTDRGVLEVPSDIGIFLENNKDTYPVFDVIRNADKFSIMVSEGVNGEKIGNKKIFIAVVSIIIFIFILLGGLMILTQKK